jgi:hypothetical protein
MPASRRSNPASRRKGSQRVLRALLSDVLLWEVLLLAAVGAPLLSAQTGTHAALAASPAAAAPLFGPPLAAPPTNSPLLNSASGNSEDESWPKLPSDAQATSWASAESSSDPLNSQQASQPAFDQAASSPDLHQAPLFDAPGTPAPLSARPAIINPFSPEPSAKSARPAPLFLLRGALDPISAALPSFQRLMHQMVALPGDGLRFARRELLFGNGLPAAPTRPAADALFGTSSLGNGVALSAGTSLGHRTQNGSTAPKIPGPAVGLKLSF